MVARRGSVSATGGPMLNPSVEPSARRESAQFRRDSATGKPQHPATRSIQDRGNGNDAGDGGSTTALSSASDAATSVAAVDARNQRRSIGLKRLSVNDHMKESLVLAQEAITQNVGAIKTSGLEKLQDIMTEAKEKGLGVSKLFHFFLAQSELSDKHGSTRSILGLLEKSALVPEETAEFGSGSGEGTGGVFKETLSSKTRAEASKRNSNTKKKSMELMPSLQNGKRPSTASSKRGSGSATGSARGPPASAREPDPTNRGGGSSGPGSRSSLARRSSSLEEAMVRDRQITPLSFQAGLTALGFKMTDEETTGLFNHLDDNKNGQIDLTEFTRFCLEIPSMAWKAERVRRGVQTSGTGAETDLKLAKAARDMANETVNGGDGADGGDGAGGLGKLGTPVTLGKVVYKGDKFFWRTKELVEVVIQLNSRVGFMAVSTFNTETLKAYPIIFVDPSKIPTNAAAVAGLLEDLKTKEMEIKKEAEMRRVGEVDGPENAEIASKKQQEEEERRAIEQNQRLSEQAQIGYIADYLLHRITMPDEDGNILQPDVTQPGVEVNPLLSSGDVGNREGERGVSGNGGVVAARRPGLMRTTFDEWDTLLFPRPPSRVTDRPKFAAKKRDSYFEDFQNKKEEFDDNRIRAHRLSAEAAAYTEEVSNLMKKLAPLNYSASAPATLREQELQLQQVGTGDPLSDLELNARPGSGRVILEDDISQVASGKRESGGRNSLLESQSAPVLPAPESAAA